MTVKVSKPAINVREELADLRKPTGVAGEAMLRAETPQEQFNLIGAGRRNLIINGAMQVAQRGTSFTNTTGYKLDRWFVANPGTNTVSQVFDTTLNMYCMSVTQSVGYGTVYKIEDKDVKHLKAGDVVTLSYWINVTSGNFRISTTATSQVSTSTTTIDTATGWYRRSASYALTSAEVAAITGGSYLQINIEPAAYAYKLTGVQLEVGKVATPFEHRSYGDELQSCMRYYSVIGGGSYVGIDVGQQFSTNGSIHGIQYPTPMRAAPSISFDNLIVTDRTVFDTPVGEFSVTTAGTSSAYIRTGWTTAVGSPGRAVLLAIRNGYAGGIKFDAEL